MPALLSALSIVLAAVMAIAAFPFSPVSTVSAQSQSGATMTVLRGEVAVIRANGSAIQPAPPGTVVDTGDEIRTLTRAGALITFFTGTEIELGEGTILAVDQITRDGSRVNVSLKQVAGVTLNRVQALASGSTYQIDAGGAIALVRGTTFSLAGPMSTSVGNVVALACLEDCTPASTLGGCAMQPFMGIGVVVERGKVASGCQTWSVQANQGYFDAAFEGITTTEQAVTGGNPGQVALGQQVASGKPVEGNTKKDDDKEKEEDKPNSNLFPTGAPVVTGPLVPCNQVARNGSNRPETVTVELGRRSGTFTFNFDGGGSIPDTFTVSYEGQTLFQTTTAGVGSRTLTFNGSSTQATVNVTPSPDPGTFWAFSLTCPT
jgi:hypothetical protein